MNKFKKAQMKRLILIIFCIVAVLKSYAQMDSLKTALILVDIQEFYFPGGKMELVEPENASLNAREILHFFREKGMPVFHVRHNFEPGGNIHENVKPIEGEKVISKDYPNSFRETELLAYLKQLEIEQLVIIGLQTHMCLEATTRAAADFGFKCIVIENACATRDLKYKDKIIIAEDVHFSTLSTLKGSYAEVLSLEEFLNRF